MKKQIISALNSKKRRTKRIVILLAVSALIVYIGFSDYGLVRYFMLKNEHKTISEEVDRLKAETEQLVNEEHLLKKKDPEYMQRIAREKFGLVKQGEKIFRLVPESDNKQ